MIEARNAAFALDHMEPLRPVVDRAILELVKATPFSGGDFSIQPDGVCRLNTLSEKLLVRRVTPTGSCLGDPMRWFLWLGA